MRVQADHEVATNGLGFTPTVPGVLRWWLSHCPDERMIIARDGTTMTFREAVERSAELAKGLVERGAGKGARVAILMPNSADYVIGFLAVGRIGGVAIGLNTLYRAPELARQIRHCDAQFLLAANSYLNHDYEARLEEAFPDLRAARAGEALMLASAPLLRSIHLLKDSVRPWAQPMRALRGDRVSDELLDAIGQAVVPADLLCIIYTSGTSAEPKGVVHTHGSLLRKASWIGRDGGIRKGDVVFNPSPFFWAGGLCNGLFCTILNGAGLLVQERFDPADTLPWLREVGVTVATGMPYFGLSMAREPLARSFDLPTLREGYLIDLLRPDSAKADAGLWPVATGMTESAGHYTQSIPGPVPESLRGVSGIPAPGIEHKVIDPDSGRPVPDGQPGELCIRGASVMQAYYKVEREDCFEPDGFFRTGDLAMVKDGYHTHLGRLKDIIKTSGANVGPGEIEEALRSFPGVADCHVVGLPDPVRGEIVAAAVVPVAGGALNADDILARLRTRLASYKVPRTLTLLAAEEIPRLANMKPDRLRLIELLNRRAPEQPTREL